MLASLWGFICARRASATARLPVAFQSNWLSELLSHLTFLETQDKIRSHLRVQEAQRTVIASSNATPRPGESVFGNQLGSATVSMGNSGPHSVREPRGRGLRIYISLSQALKS